MANLLRQLNNETGKDLFIHSILEGIAENVYAAVNRRNTNLSGRAKPLSPREIEVLQLLAQQLRNQEIAEQLFISLPTVKRHCANIYSKLKVKNRQEAVKQAQQLGMV